ncbi:MAG: DarT ssDNA thymidine ADP-ribosyltransferase family protein, partial [Cellulosilyticum sp.]|nr:DarT ssDNA thymidine ADP-ribosyltransferase family protein [Cellulosilyticum sp.]
MPRNCPTDIQAEVMILNEIEMNQVEGIIVESDQQAKSEYTKLKLCGKENQYKIIVCPDIFKQRTYTNLQQSGIVPVEYEWRG